MPSIPGIYSRLDPSKVCMGWRMIRVQYQLALAPLSPKFNGLLTLCANLQIVTQASAALLRPFMTCLDGSHRLRFATWPALAVIW